MKTHFYLRLAVIIQNLLHSLLRQKIGHQFLLFVVLTAFCATLQGCSVYLAARQPDEKDLSVLQPGTSRALVIAELGQPSSTEEQAGLRTDVYKFKNGYSTLVKVARSAFHGTADVFSFGLWEAVGIPIELTFTGKNLTVQVTYDGKDRVKTVQSLSGTITRSEIYKDIEIPGVPAPLPPVSVTPILMPSPLTQLPTRLAVTSETPGASTEVSPWLDLTITHLQRCHPGLRLVEREGLPSVEKEIVLQHSGRADDSTSVGVGRWSGADALLTYKLIKAQPAKLEAVAERGGELSVAVEVRLIQVETGTTLHRQTATATTHVPAPTRYRSWPEAFLEKMHNEISQIAQAYTLASIVAAFGDNPLGLVPDLSAQGEGVRVLGVLHGGPAHLSGVKEGDRVLAINGQSFGHWAFPVSLPATVTVERTKGRRDLVFSIRQERKL